MILQQDSSLNIERLDFKAGEGATVSSKHGREHLLTSGNLPLGLELSTYLHSDVFSAG